MSLSRRMKIKEKRRMAKLIREYRPGVVRPLAEDGTLTMAALLDTLMNPMFDCKLPAPLTAFRLQCLELVLPAAPFQGLGEMT